MWLPLTIGIYGFWGVTSVLSEGYSIPKNGDALTPLLNFGVLLKEQIPVLNKLNPKCQDDLMSYFKTLASGNITSNPWALEMIDSIKKGFSSGGLDQIWSENVADYEECLEAKNAERRFEGQVCFIRLNWKPAIHGLTIYHFYPACLPSSCSERELRDSFKIIDLQSTMNAPASMLIEEGYCFTKDTNWANSRYPYALILWFTLISVLSFSTIWHFVLIQRGKGDQLTPVLRIFSVISGVKDFFTSEESKNDIKVIHGLRVLAKIMIVFLHFKITVVTGPFVNGKRYFYSHLSYENLPCNFFIMVDVFFFISWFLVTFDFIKNYSMDGSLLTAYRKIALRMLRFQSILAFHLFAIVPMFLPLLNNVGAVKLIDTLNFCQGEEWKHLTFTLSTFHDESRYQCEAYLWQFSAEIQLTLIIPLIVVFLVKYPRAGWFILVMSSIASLSYKWYCAYVYEYFPEVVPSLPGQFKHYQRSYNRLNVLATSVFFALQLYKDLYITKRKQLPKQTLNFAWTAWIITWIALFFFNLAYVTPDGSKPVSSFYVANLIILEKIATPIIFGWLIYASIHGHGGVFEKPFTWKGFRYLGKLGIGMTFLHFGNQAIRRTTYTAPFNYNAKYKARKATPEIISLFISSFLFNVLIESPLMQITAYIFNKVWPPKSKKPHST